MWTSTLDLTPVRIIPTRVLGGIFRWQGAYFSSFAPLQIQNLPRQALPAASWVRVRNRLAGICGSDLHLVYANGDFRIAPAALPKRGYLYPGHEVVGEVIEVGEDVQQLSVGDRVVLQHGPNCISTGSQPLCRSCAAGNYALCENPNLPGPFPFGGGWSEEMLLHEQQLFRLPSDLSEDQGVLIEPTAVALRALLHSIPQPGDRVLIIGAGAIGLLLLELVRALCPETEISVLAKHPFQVEKATRMGAAHIIYSTDSYNGVQKATGARIYQGMLGNKALRGGFDLIYDTIGNRSTVHNSLRWARAQAAVVLVGLSMHPMYLDLSPIWDQEISLVGTRGHGLENWPIGTREWRSTFDVVVDLMQHGTIHPERLLTHRFALNDYREALTIARDKGAYGSIKVAFDYSLQPASVVPNVRATAARPRRTASLSYQSEEIEEPVEEGPLNRDNRQVAPPRDFYPHATVEEYKPEEEESGATLKMKIPTAALKLREQRQRQRTTEEVVKPAPAEADPEPETLRFKKPTAEQIQQAQAKYKQSGTVEKTEPSLPEEPTIEVPTEEAETDRFQAPTPEQIHQAQEEQSSNKEATASVTVPEDEAETDRFQAPTREQIHQAQEEHFSPEEQEIHATASTSDARSLDAVVDHPTIEVPSPTLEEHSTIGDPSTPLEPIVDETDPRTEAIASEAEVVSGPDSVTEYVPAMTASEIEMLETRYVPAVTEEKMEEELQKETPETRDVDYYAEQGKHVAELTYEPENENYEATIFDIPPEEQLAWLSDMQETTHEPSVSQEEEEGAGFEEEHSQKITDARELYRAGVNNRPQASNRNKKKKRR